MKKVLVLITLIMIVWIGYLLINNSNEKVKNNLSDNIPSELLKDNMFNKYSKKAYKKLKNMTLDQKIGQLFLVRYPDNNGIEENQKYNFGGYLFFAKDFKDKTKNEIISMINSIQENSSIPLIAAVDEEGGTVVRLSSNKNIRNDRFLSPSDLYKEGGLDRIKEDTKEKSKLLYELGINLNLAPVVDVTTNENDYMYSRAIDEDANVTSLYAKTVIETSKGSNVSYTLKHFPGYGNNGDTHTSSSKDTRTYEEIEQNDIKPFKAGIKSGAEAVLISHNIVDSIDSNNPASLSKKIHELLINKLDFNGVIITDDLDMGAITGDYKAIIYKAIISLNTFIIVTDYQKSIEYTKALINEKKIDKKIIDKAVFKILSWKYYKKLIS